MPDAPTVLVTGGAGYIGSHACKALAEAGWRPVVYDNMDAGHAWAVRWGPLEEGDTRDRARLDDVLRRWRPHAVMHFAAHIAAGESVADPGKYYDNNVGGSITLLRAMAAAGVDRLVFSSTAAVYGEPETAPIPETHPLRPINPYGATKLMVERALEDFARAHGLRAAALRYFNAAGADPDGETGEAHDPETHLIPLVLEAAAGLRPRIEVFGDDYPTPDGTCIRDYIHVSDLAAAHVAALAALDGAPGVRAWNLGNGAGFSVAEVIAGAERVTGRPVPVSTGPRRAGDPPVLIAESARAAAELGWRRRFPDVETQIAHAWAWLMRAHRPEAAAAGGEAAG